MARLRLGPRDGRTTGSLAVIAGHNGRGFAVVTGVASVSMALAVAVAEAGGVGSITALGMTAAQVDRVLAGMTARTDGVLAVNFLTAGIDQEAVAAAATRVRIVDFFWADPDPGLVEIAHRGGALACWQVGSLDEARAASEAGCDVVVVQGTEAGGHVRGDSPLQPLLESVLGQVAATGHIDAMPMYAGESAAAISAVEPAGQIIESWAAAVQR